MAVKSGEECILLDISNEAKKVNRSKRKDEYTNDTQKAIDPLRVKLKMNQYKDDTIGLQSKGEVVSRLGTCRTSATIDRKVGLDGDTKVGTKLGRVMTIVDRKHYCGLARDVGTKQGQCVDSQCGGGVCSEVTKSERGTVPVPRAAPRGVLERCRNVVVLVSLLMLLSSSRGAGCAKVGGPKYVDDKVQNYLSNFGYLPQSGSEAGNLRTEDQLREAIRDLQRFGHVPVTGEIDSMTQELLRKPRCGLPDQPHGGQAKRRKRFVQQGNVWNHTDLTWSLQRKPQNLDTGGVRSVLARALSVWSDHSKLSFTEINSDKADIVISFAKRYHDDNYPFDGRGQILAHAFFPGSGRGGDAHFDDEEIWLLHDPKEEEDGTSLFAVAAHEFGHSLGLSHSSVQGALMYPWYQGNKPNFELPEDDRLGIQNMYGSKEERMWGKIPQNLPTEPPRVHTTERPEVRPDSRPRYPVHYPQDRNPDPRYPKNRTTPPPRRTYTERTPERRPEHPRPEPPGARPDQPGARPENPRPGYRPEYPPGRPEYPAGRPEYPAGRPDRPESRPEYPGRRPEYPERWPENPEQRPTDRKPDYNNPPRYYPVYTTTTARPQIPEEHPDRRTHKYPENKPHHHYPHHPHSTARPHHPQTTENPYHHPVKPDPPRKPYTPKKPYVPAKPWRPDRNPEKRYPIEVTPFGGTKAPKPDSCNTNYDAVALIRGEVFIFKSQYLWRITDSGVMEGYPTIINRMWHGLPENLTHVDAAYERPDRKIVFFIGKQYYVFNATSLVPGYPRPLTDLGLPSSLEHLNAAMVWGHNGKTYLYNETMYWKFDEDVGRVELDYPRDMAMWKGVGNNVDSVFQWKDGKTYFFKGKGFWKFNDLHMRVENERQRLSGPFWMGCPYPADEDYSFGNRQPYQGLPPSPTSTFDTSKAHSLTYSPLILFTISIFFILNIDLT